MPHDSTHTAHRSPSVRMAFAKLVGAVVALDIVAIAVLKLGHVDTRGPAVLQRYVVVWTLASALVAGWGLWQVQRARRAWRRRRDDTDPDAGSGAPRED
jgi:hypothetical protein